MKLGMIRQWRAECFDYAKEKGLSFIEICRNYDADAEEFIAHADEVRANVERTGVSIGSVGRWNAKPNVGGKLDDAVYDRLGADSQYTSILDVEVPTLTIPVKPGRNLAVIIEVAAMNSRQKKLGYNTAEEFNQRLMEQAMEE